MLGFLPLASGPLADDGVESTSGVSVSVTGVSSTGSVGSVSVATGVTVDVPVTGVAATGSVGSVTIDAVVSIDVPVTGVSANAGPHAEVNYTVTVADNNGNKFYIDGVSNPTLELTRGTTYVFDLSDSSVSGHPLAFRESDDTSYTTGVTSTGTAGSSGAKVTIVVASDAPSSLKYYCTAHGNGMGNSITVSDLIDVDAKSNVSVTGLAATGGVGSTTVTGVGNVAPTGIAATGSVGSITAVGNAIQVIASAEGSTASVGSVSTVGDSILSVTGLGSTASVGEESVSGAADIPETGLASTGGVGSVVATGIGNIDTTGVSGAGAVG